MRVLCIGLVPKVQEAVTVSLRLRWPDVNVTETPEIRPGLDTVEAEAADLVLLQTDPRSGMSLLDAIRELRQFSEVPLMVWEMDGGEVELVKALEFGADDYIRLPVGPIELIARMVALLRRLRGESSTAEGPVIWSGKLGINPTTYEAFLGEDRLDLTPTEFRLLYVLVKNRSAVVSHRFLERLLWEDRYDSGSLLKKYIQRIRKKLGDDPVKPTFVANVRGVGYRYVGSSNGTGHPVTSGSVVHQQSA